MRRFSFEECTQIAEEVKNAGYAIIPGYLDADQVARSQDLVKAEVARNNGAYTQFLGREEMTPLFEQDVSACPDFIFLYKTVYEHLAGRPAPDDPPRQMVRCFMGRDDKGHALNFHFDSFVVTFVIPILIPETGLAGDLLLLPNIRSIRKYYISNVLDKLLYSNAVAQYILKKLHQRNARFIKRVPLTPGNLYILCGYSTLHTNESCNPDEIRATAIFHFANPHGRSWKTLKSAQA